MILTALLLAAASSAAPQRIYQCRSARGETAYQDRPCDGDARQQLSEGGEQALRQWLEQQRAANAGKRSAGPSRPPARATASPREPAGAAPLASRSAAQERLIASCSERFLGCATADTAAMDACVASLPRCGSRSAGCCPAACIERYQSLRREGEGLASAVRMALLDPFAPSCAAPR